ncbi:MAG TPA: response regulator, partial [Candidatus Methylomirabilis sp.]|nr:response regulator [Candidatus Methylomirabilis sp.]
MNNNGRTRLLIVDDETEIRNTLAQYFGSVGYAVETAQDVSEALQKLPSGFDIVLSDIKMPGVSGIEFLQQARRTNPRLGIFLITGY